ncbi:uncharacterized protein BX663DRAFT_501950 [Cokeromyces recurvatus]|uniref:uncharacterized protein n=1 Tax=Cokeromyces recurvatus TaxID=90255 RepID=UPI00221EDB58|nr:uncharacterized protein BX663DRAFT_501950 [Cokeromyces recurvatus]KAI7905169.1 hypothetical protein BX663DRAFT_501950 [Cokeromyces recurvatus]
MKLNIANPATGCQKLIEIEDERRLALNNSSTCDQINLLNLWICIYQQSLYCTI